MNDRTKLRKKSRSKISVQKDSRVEKLVCVEILFYFFFVQMKMTCVLMKETITS